MFDKRLLATAGAILLVAALSFVLSHSDEIPMTAPIGEEVEGVKINAAPKSQGGVSSTVEPEEQDYAYVLKEHDGRIAVFSAEKTEPDLVLDVLVKYLPDLDRTQMQQGIYVKDYEELVKLIEDYVS